MNPLYQKTFNQPSQQPTIEDFQQKLSQVDDSFLNRMVEEARKRGISEQDISAGLNFIRSLRR